MKNNLPYLEDIYLQHFKNTFNILFPKKCNNKYFIYLLSIIHIIGASFIQWGVFLKNKYLPFYLFYIILIIYSYYIFNNKCFVTLISNKYSGLKESSFYLKNTTARNILLFNAFITAIAIIYPEVSLYNIMNYWFS